MLRYFGPILTPSLCHTLSHISSRDLLNYVTHLRPPIFSSRPTCIHTCLYRGFVLVHGGFCWGVCLGVFLSGRFRPGWFLSVPPSVRIYPLQQKTKHHFQF